MASYQQVPRAGAVGNGGVMSGYGGSLNRAPPGGVGNASGDPSNSMPRSSSHNQLHTQGAPSPSRPPPRSIAVPGGIPSNRQLRYAPSSNAASSASSASQPSLSAARPHLPSPSPPTRPLPVPRSASAAPPIRNSASNDRSPASTSPPDSPPSSSQPSHPLLSAKSSSVHNRFHQPSSSPSRSSSSVDERRDDDYSPKRKKSVSAVTIFVFAGICFTLLLFLTYVSNNYARWAWLAAARSVSSATRLHTLLPASSIHHPLIGPMSPPPLVNLSSILGAYQTLHKRLPFHPPMDQDHAQPPAPADTPLSHPWYFPPPVTFTAVLPKPYERAPIHYVTNVTPKHLRKHAVPGTDPSMEVEDAGATGQPDSDPSAADASDGDGLVNGMKVVAGVKVRPPITDDDALEWTEEERELNRAKFKNATLNKNLVDRIVWRPPVQTLAAATAKDFPPPVIGEEQYIFKDDYLWIILTEKKDHGLVRKIRSTWGQYVKHWLIYSDFYDSKLNTTVIKNPQPSWAPHDYKSSSWKVSAYIAHLAKHTELHRPFYVVIDQYSFPLLDQIKWRFDEWRQIWKEQYPAFVVGRPDKRPFKFAYYNEQQQTAASLFSEQLQVVPMYAYGFDHMSLMTMSYYTPVDICPPLSDDNMALAGLIQCAGGITQEHHFLAMTRSNHREKGVTAGAVLQQWRLLDVYSQTRTAGMLEEAFGWYYGALTKAK